METYLVGGAVRDELLGLKVHDRDWVVVGATPKQMLDQGYRQVGKDFPVFLHPQTHEEHALARTERKTGPGYRGFEVDASEQVTLEQDLLRRDLTINAMARNESGELIDPFGGASDLQAGILRHVSPAFREDPVRILRIARFVARYAKRGFKVADETMALMNTMVAEGEVDALVAERVWQEMSRALAEPSPSQFFLTLRQCGALKRILPELDALFGVPQPPQHHPEVDTGDHVMMVVEQARKLTKDKVVIFAALVHDLGKGLTPEDELPSHRGHERAGLEPVNAVCERLRVPKEYRALATRVCEHHLKCHKAFELRPGKLFKLLTTLDAFRNPTQFERFLLACKADAKGRLGFENRDYPQVEYLRSALAAASQVSVAELQKRGLQGAQLGQALQQQRILAIKKMANSKS